MKQNLPPDQRRRAPGPSHESSTSAASKDKQAVRRRLVGATLGAPVIYTLSSGAAFARGSSCMANPDNYRGGAKVVDSTAGTTTDSTSVLHEPPSQARRQPNGTVSPREPRGRPVQSQDVSEEANAVSSEEDDGWDSSTSTDSGKREVVINGHKVCDLADDNTCEIGGVRYRFYGHEDNGVLATESCWNSIHPSAINSLLR